MRIFTWARLPLLGHTVRAIEGSHLRLMDQIDLHHDNIAQATADRQAAVRLFGEEILALQAFKL